MQISLEQLEALLEKLENKKVAEFEYEDETIRLRVALGRPPVAVAAIPQPASLTVGAGDEAAGLAAKASEAAEVGMAYVTSPFVGTFYRAPSPDADNFVEPGAQAKKGQPLCIIEAMKLMNEIETEFPCTIVEVLVENGKSVEFGQKLFKVRKT